MLGWHDRLGGRQPAPPDAASPGNHQLPARACTAACLAHADPGTQELVHLLFQLPRAPEVLLRSGGFRFVDQSLSPARRRNPLGVSAKDLARRLSGASEGGGTLIMRGIEFGAAGLVLLFGLGLLFGYLAAERVTCL